MSEKPSYAGTVKFFLPGPVWVRPEVLAVRVARHKRATDRDEAREPVDQSQGGVVRANKAATSDPRFVQLLRVRIELLPCLRGLEASGVE